MDVRTVFFVGKPGSGKGTQAALLATRTGWPVVGTSGGLRAIIAEGGAAGHKLQETMDSGLLVPYWVVSHVYLKEIFSVPETGSVIFDGTGRTPPEAEIVLDSIRWLERPFAIFHLNVSDDSVRRRIELRKANGERKDDHALEKRLEEYYANTDKAIDYYRRAGVLTEIDGEPAPEIIAADIQACLGL